MPSSQTLYTATLVNGLSNAPPSDGFVDNLTIEEYYGATDTPLTPTPAGLTLALCQAKVRGNVRFRELVNQFGLVANMYFTEKANVVGTNTQPYTVSNGTALTEPTSFQFWLIIEHGDASLVTPDEFNPGQFLTGAACIQRCIARALTNTMYRQEIVYNPTATTTTGPYGGTNAAPRYGPTYYPTYGGAAFEIGPYSSTIGAVNPFIIVSEVTF